MEDKNYNVPISYSKLLEIKNSKYISYEEKLNTLEWKNIRDKILKRDSYRCTKCLKNANSLAWWLNKSSPFEIFFRYPNEIEKKYMADSIIHETEMVVLHVHHKYYIKNYLPWEYDNDSLVSLCSDCHKFIHLSTKIYIYENDLLQNPELLIPCEKCAGTGYLPEYHYHRNGICFSCNGNRFLN